MTKFDLVTTFSQQNDIRCIQGDACIICCIPYIITSITRSKYYRLVLKTPFSHTRVIMSHFIASKRRWIWRRAPHGADQLNKWRPWSFIDLLASAHYADLNSYIHEVAEVKWVMAIYWQRFVKGRIFLAGGCSNFPQCLNNGLVSNRNRHGCRYCLITREGL